MILLDHICYLKTCFLVNTHKMTQSKEPIIYANTSSQQVTSTGHRIRCRSVSNNGLSARVVLDICLSTQRLILQVANNEESRPNAVDQPTMLSRVGHASRHTVEMVRQQ